MHWNAKGSVVPALVALLLGACSTDSPSPPSPSFSTIQTKYPDALDFKATAAAELAAAVDGRQLRDVEDDILRMEAKLPGFGGLFVDSTGTVVVYGPAGSEATAVRAALAEHASEFHLLPEHQQQLTAGDQVRVLPAQYSFSELLAWQQGLASLGGPNDGIVSYDADESQDRVAVGIVDDAARERLFARATAIGVPPEAIVTEITVYPHLQRALLDSSLTSTLAKPLRAGAEINVHGVGACTMGYVVRGSDVTRYFLTASHCAPGRGTGSFIYQNGSQSRHVGIVLQNPGWSVAHPDCGWYTWCTWADVLKGQMEDSIWIPTTPPFTAPPFTRWTTPTGSTAINGTSTITGEQSVYIGMSITRVGRSTGTTTGAVDTMYYGGIERTCVAAGFDDINLMNLCVARVKNNGGGAGGDSGGPVVSGTLAVGIHVGGGCSPLTGECRTYFNSLQTAHTTIAFGNPY